DCATLTVRKTAHVSMLSRTSGAMGLTTIRRKFVSPISAFTQEAVSVKGRHHSFCSCGSRQRQARTTESRLVVVKELSRTRPLERSECVTLPLSRRAHQKRF